MYMRVFRETIFTKLFDITQAKNFESKKKSSILIKRAFLEI